MEILRAKHIELLNTDAEHIRQKLKECKQGECLEVLLAHEQAKALRGEE